MFVKLKLNFMCKFVLFYQKFRSLHTKLSSFSTCDAKKSTKIFNSKRSFEKAVKPSQKIQRLVLENGLGRPVTIDEHKAFHSCLQQAKLSPIFLGQIKPQIKLCSSTIKFESLPKPIIPEIAVTGRSNCGKSQLINSICGQIGACLVGKLPGTTRKINFYKIGSPSKLVIVDLPGYGFSSLKQEKQVQLMECVKKYLESRSNLKRVIIAIDSRLGLKRSDLEMLSFLEHNKIKWQAVLTKCDLVVPYRLCQKIQVTQMELSQFKGSVYELIPISALRNQNLNSLRISIEKVSQNHIAQKNIVKTQSPVIDKQETNVDLLDIDYTSPFLDTEVIEYLSFDQIIESNISKMVNNLCSELVLEESSKPIQIDTFPSLLTSSIDSTHGNNLLFDFEGVITEINKKSIMPIPEKKAKPLPVFAGKKYTYPLELPKNQSTTLVKQMPKSIAMELFPRLNLSKIKGSLKYRILGRNRSTRLQFSALRNLSLYKKVKENKPIGTTDWNKIYAKYIRWARKYPELASLNKVPVSKAVVVSEYKNEIKRTAKKTISM